MADRKGDQDVFDQFPLLEMSDEDYDALMEEIVNDNPVVETVLPNGEVLVEAQD